MNKICFFVNGPQGSGKGTQGKLLANRYDCERIVAGDELSARAKRDSEYQNLITQYQLAGLLVPDGIIVSTITDTIVRRGLLSRHLILDGCMRTEGQTALVLDWVRRRNYHPVVFFLECREEIVLKRISARREMENRIDDKDDEVIRRRLNAYYDHLPAVLDEISRQNLISYMIDANERSAEEIVEDICSIVDSEMCNVE